MPHIILTLWPGKSRQQKQQLADEITRSVTGVLGYGDGFGRRQERRVDGESQR